MSPIKRSFVNALLGFFVYGVWGMLVNLMHGYGPAIKAGIVQGSFSFVLTFIMTILMETIFRHFMQLIKQDIWAAIGTIFVSCTLVFSGSWCINYLAGTPEILNTVILGYVLGGFYSVIYAIVLVKQNRSYSSKQG